jgi:hypothetical protein
MVMGISTMAMNTTAIAVTSLPFMFALEPR